MKPTTRRTTCRRCHAPVLTFDAWGLAWHVDLDPVRTPPTPGDTRLWERQPVWGWTNAPLRHRGDPIHRTHLCPTPTPVKEPTMTTVPTFAAYTEPVAAEGDTFKPHENVGHVVIVKVREFKPSVVTANTPDGGPAVVVDVVDLDGAAGPAVFRDVLWMGGAFVDGLKGHAPGQSPTAGAPLVLVIGTRKSKSGRNYAVPTAATDAHTARAADYYRANGDPFAATFGTVTPPPPAGQNTAPPF